MTQRHLIFLLFYVAAQVQTNDLAAPVMMMPTIDKLDVRCTSSGMLVDLAFTAPFSGVVFSKGHFLDPACRYIQNPGSDRLQFTIPLEKCGTAAITKEGKPAVENLIVIQGDNRFQEMWDSSRKIICELSAPPSGKTVIQRYRVSMLDFQEVHFPGELSEISVKMKLLTGDWPQVVQLQEIVRIGDAMTVCIEVLNPGDFGTEVRNCYAYDSSDINDADTNKLQLTDDRGCSVQTKLLGSFTLDQSSTKEKHVHIGIMNAFTFPDTMDVYIGCEVEVCRGGCDVCDNIVPTKEPPTTRPILTDDCKPGDLRPKCMIVCDEVFYDSRCPPKSTTTAPTTPVITTLAPTTPAPTTPAPTTLAPTTTAPTTSAPLTPETFQPCTVQDPPSERCPCVAADQRSECNQQPPCGIEVTSRCPCVPGDLRPGCVRPKCGPDSPVSNDCPCDYKDTRPECRSTTPAAETTTAPPPEECGPNTEVNSRCPCVPGDLRPGCVRPKCGPDSPVSNDCPCDYKDTRPECQSTTPAAVTTTAPPPPPEECGPTTEVSSRCPCVAGDLRPKCITPAPTTTPTPATSTTTKPSASKVPTAKPPTRPPLEPSGCGPECPDVNHPFHNFLLQVGGNKKKNNKKPAQEYRKKRSLTEGKENVGVVVIGRYRAV